MMTADYFDATIRAGKKTGESMGRTKLISAALSAYEQSKAQNQADAEQASYLYQVIKLCNWWLTAKSGTNKRVTTTMETRRITIESLRDQANQRLMQHPIVYNALKRYNQQKARGAQPATSLKDVYAHEGSVYQEAKAQGQFYDPHLTNNKKLAKKLPSYNPPSTSIADRWAPSATKLGGAKQSDITKIGGGTPFKQFTFEQYMHLDELLGRQYKVLYLSKLQRLPYMVPVDFGVFWRPLDGKPYDMPGSQVGEDIQAPATAYFYACDRYKNLFVMKNDMKDARGNYIQLNHSTLVAGRDVICAGTISIKGGTLRGVTNSSGHYLPSTQDLTNFLKLLQTDGGVTLDASVVVIDMARQIFTTADQFLQGNYQDLYKTDAMKALLKRTA